ncbi:MAG: 50S ribosomal protein L21 [Calditrichaeota bacterium]|nr:50S ribosomal protein L21 [Calditrichota bacterium]
MYAIVEIAGKQFRVEEKRRLRVPLLQVENGKKVQLDKVLAFNDDKGNLTIGTPLVEKVSVSATVVEHGREKKIVVFKKKRRKGYQKKNGHRQDYSLIEINTIGAGALKPKAESKVQAAEKPKAEETAKQVAEKPKAPAKVKKADAEKTAAKKPAAKKTTAKKAETKKDDKEA